MFFNKVKNVKAYMFSSFSVTKDEIVVLVSNYFID